jgi:hypothetical protein
MDRQHGSATWIGNTPKVAKDSYLQVTDDHFAKAAQNPAQHLHVHPGTKPQSEKPNIKKALQCRVLRVSAT